MFKRKSLTIDTFMHLLINYIFYYELHFSFSPFNILFNELWTLYTYYLCMAFRTIDGKISYNRFILYNFDCVFQNHIQNFAFSQ